MIAQLSGCWGGVPRFSKQPYVQKLQKTDACTWNLKHHLARQYQKSLCTSSLKEFCMYINLIINVLLFLLYWFILLTSCYVMSYIVWPSKQAKMSACFWWIFHDLGNIGDGRRTQCSGELGITTAFLNHFDSDSHGLDLIDSIMIGLGIV